MLYRLSRRLNLRTVMGMHGSVSIEVICKNSQGHSAHMAIAVLPPFVFGFVRKPWMADRMIRRLCVHVVRMFPLPAVLVVATVERIIDWNNGLSRSH